MTRRQWLAAGAALTASSCARRHGAGYPGHALIACAGEKSAVLIDLASFRLVKDIPLGGAASQVGVNDATGASYVMTPETGSLHVLDVGFRRVAQRRLSDHLVRFALTKDGTRGYALAPGPCEVVAVSGRDLASEGRWRLDGAPAAIDVATDGSAAIATGAHGTVNLIEAKSGKRTTKDLGAHLGEVRFRADGKLLLVANRSEHMLTALAVPSLEVMVHLPLALEPQNLCFNADGGQLFVTGRGMDGVAIAFPYLPLEIEQTVLAGRDPGVMATSSEPGYLFVASASGSDVCVLNIDDRKVIGVVGVGQRPAFIAITPDSEYALVLNEASGDMAVIDIAALEANLGNPDKMRGKASAALFTMLPVGERPVHAAIVPRASV